MSARVKRKVQMYYWLRKEFVKIFFHFVIETNAFIIHIVNKIKKIKKVLNLFQPQC